MKYLKLYLHSLGFAAIITSILCVFVVFFVEVVFSSATGGLEFIDFKRLAFYYLLSIPILSLMIFYNKKNI